MLNINIKKDILSTKGLSLGFLSIFILGFFTGEFYQPSSTIGLIGFLIVSIVKGTQDGVSLNDFKNPYLYAYLILFSLYLLGMFTTAPENWDYFGRRVTLKLPFILFPLGFIVQSNYSKREVTFLVSFFLSLMFLSELGSLLYYATHFEEVNQLYLQSKVMPVVANHVRYSLMACFATFSSFYIYKVSTKKIYLFAAIFFAIFQHLLAVRSGLFIFYLVAGSYALYLLKTKSLKQKLSYGMSALVILALSLFLIPPLHNKVLNTLDDLQHVNETKQASNYSLVGRQFSYKVGWELFQRSPMIGIGVGNMESEKNKLYAKNYPEISKRLKPHNQFIHVLTESGIVGIIVFTAAFYFPLFYKKNYKGSSLLVIHFAIVTLSFLFEGTLETQLGFNFSMFFIFLFLSHQGNFNKHVTLP